MAPSLMVGFKPGTVESFYFDRGIWLWGSRIESEMDKASAKAKSKILGNGARQRVLNSYIRPGSTKGVYRDPAMGKKASPQQGRTVIGGFSG